MANTLTIPQLQYLEAQDPGLGLQNYPGTLQQYFAGLTNAAGAAAPLVSGTTSISSSPFASMPGVSSLSDYMNQGGDLSSGSSLMSQYGPYAAYVKDAIDAGVDISHFFNGNGTATEAGVEMVNDTANAVGGFFSFGISTAVQGLGDLIAGAVGGTAGRVISDIFNPVQGLADAFGIGGVPKGLKTQEVEQEFQSTPGGQQMAAAIQDLQNQGYVLSSSGDDYLKASLKDFGSAYLQNPSFVPQGEESQYGLAGMYDQNFKNLYPNVSEEQLAGILSQDPSQWAAGVEGTPGAVTGQNFFNQGYVQAIMKAVQALDPTGQKGIDPNQLQQYLQQQGYGPGGTTAGTTSPDQVPNDPTDIRSALTRLTQAGVSLADAETWVKAHLGPTPAQPSQPAPTGDQGQPPSQLPRLGGQDGQQPTPPPPNPPPPPIPVIQQITPDLSGLQTKITPTNIPQNLQNITANLTGLQTQVTPTQIPPELQNITPDLSGLQTQFQPSKDIVPLDTQGRPTVGDWQLLDQPQPGTPPPGGQDGGTPPPGGDGGTPPGGQDGGTPPPGGGTQDGGQQCDLCSTTQALTDTLGGLQDYLNQTKQNNPCDTTTGQCYTLPGPQGGGTQPGGTQNQNNYTNNYNQNQNYTNTTNNNNTTNNTTNNNTTNWYDYYFNNQNNPNGNQGTNNNTNNVQNNTNQLNPAYSGFSFGGTQSPEGFMNMYSPASSQYGQMNNQFSPQSYPFSSYGGTAYGG